MPWGNGTQQGELYQKAMNKMIWNDSQIDINTFNQAVENFKIGSSVNVGETGKAGTGVYKNFKIHESFKSPIIGRFFPLVE